MGLRLNSCFTKAIERAVDDCSTPYQLRACLNRYTNYLYIEEVRSVYFNRIKFFEDKYSHDALLLRATIDLKDDLEIEAQISNICSNTLIDPRKSDYNNVYDGDNTEEEIESLKKLFTIMNGNKLSICRYLGIEPKMLNLKLKQYDLKSFLNDIRKDFRMKLKNKLGK